MTCATVRDFLRSDGLTPHALFVSFASIAVVCIAFFCWKEASTACLGQLVCVAAIEAIFPHDGITERKARFLA
jgi:hypothetical protein